MKNKILFSSEKIAFTILTTIFSLFFISSISSQIKVDANGKVGIHNSSPNKELGVNGETKTTDLTVGDEIVILHGTGANNVIKNSMVARGVNLTNQSDGGLLIENFSEEGAGLYLDQDYAIIYSPGDGGSNSNNGTYGYLLKVIDEDGMQLKWYIDGSGYDYHNSDFNRKENIKEIKNNKDKIKQLKAVKYNFKKVEDNSSNKDNNVKFDPSKKKYYGFIAQDVEKIYPEIVDTDENGDKYVSYIQFIPILLSAINEQSDSIQRNSIEIVSLNQKLSNLKTQIEELQASLKNAESSNETLKSATLQGDDTEDALSFKTELYQNIPNPFSENTMISYQIAEDVTDAALYIYDMNGTQIKKYTLNQRGVLSTTINGSELNAGMYLYSLIADGQIIDTKRMVLTD